MQTKLSAQNNPKSSINRSKRSDFFKPASATLYLSDGTAYSGICPDWQAENSIGEVVFNTGMTGYVESLTDPSYAGQLLVFTYPLIGNYGVDVHAGESSKIQVAGVVVSEAAETGSHTSSTMSLLQWLRNEHIPIIMDIDTRALTKHLRTRGTMPGMLTQSTKKPARISLSAHFVGVAEPRSYNQQYDTTVIVVDCGAKENIVRSLEHHPIHIKRVPYDYDYTKEAYDGVLLSNGPGNPTDYGKTIKIARKALALGKPMFGICLGTQIMGLAAGAKTYKLQYGHRGHNQPCLQTATERGYITSQNHGYALDEQSLPTGWVTSFRNLNDGSVEGIEHTTKPFFSVQFHPEACPGPTDTAWLFERFIASL
jgi:carbamoyl-phosphate synthase small subunit